MEEFESIARHYVESLGEILPGYKYGFQFSKDFLHKYYFDFIFLTLDGSIPAEPPVAGGACGFTIDKNSREIETLTIGDFAMLTETETALDDVFARLQQVNNSSGSLAWLKSTYKLTSSELLAFKKMLAQTDLTKEMVIQQLERINQKATDSATLKNPS